MTDNNAIADMDRTQQEREAETDELMEPQDGEDEGEEALDRED